MLGNKTIYSVPCLIRKFNSIDLENEFGLDEDSIVSNKLVIKKNLFIPFIQ